MDESSKERRKKYYAYINNLNLGIHKEFEYHSKLISDMQRLTFEEIDILALFHENYEKILQSVAKKENPLSPPNYKLDRGVNAEETGTYKTFSNIGIRQTETLLTTLSVYGLINVGFGRLNGTYFGPVSEYGVILLDFINEGKDE